MQPNDQAVANSKAMLWSGRILSGLLIAFFLFDASGKLMRIDPVLKASVELGIPDSVIFGIGVALTVSTVFYMIPQTAILGAILLTGYMGGAIMTHVRMEGPLFNIVFGVIFGMLVWLGIYLREPRLRAILPLR